MESRRFVDFSQLSSLALRFANYIRSFLTCSNLSSEMSQISNLLQVTEEEKEKILKEYNMSLKEFEDSVEVLKSWFKQLDNIIDSTGLSDNHLKMALLNSKMSIEKAKRSIEGYLTIKTLYEDFLQNLVPEEKFRRIAPFAQTVVMPRLLPSLSRLHVGRVLDHQTEAENGLDYYLPSMMIGELRMYYDFALSSTILIDMKNFTLKHLMKFTPTVNYKLIHILTTLNLRIENIHLVNAPLFYDKINIILKALLPTKIFSKVQIHNSYEDLYRYIPKEYLPSDFGGYERSLDELYDIWLKELEANEDLFRKMSQLRVEKVLKVTPLSVDTGMGMDGSFKKLEID